MAERLSYWPADPSVGVLDLTAGDLLRRTAATDPDRTALVSVAPSLPGSASEAYTRTWTYAQLLAEAEQAAQWLLTRFAPGENIAVWAPNVPEWVILQYGAALAGLVLVTANPALRAGELEYVLGQSKSVGLAYVDEFRGTDMSAIVNEVRPRLPQLRDTIRFTTWDAEVGGFAGPERPLPAVSPEDAAQVQYTSGTTGFPKGALLHHRGLITNAWYVHRRAQFPEHGGWATSLPLFHTAGCGMSVLGTAASRGTLVLTQSFDPKLVLHALQHWKADLFGGVPAMYVALLNHPDFDAYDLGSVTITASGGDSVPAGLAEQVERRFGARFTIVYGQTELSPIITQTSPDDVDQDRYGTVGRPLWNVEVKIVDPTTGDTVAVGEQGEICARGYQAMLEYFDMPEETSRTVDAEGWLHTGDLGVLDERGYLRVTGRIKDMIIRGGENIYPREIELALLTHPGVAGAAVLGVPDEEWGERVAAVVLARDADDPPHSEELHVLLRERLAPHKTPKEWYLATDLPANAMGKIQKFVLRRRILDGALPALPNDGLRT
jgi:fatty-acyl-CoA synthase